MSRFKTLVTAAVLNPNRTLWCIAISLLLHSAVLVYFSGADRRRLELPIQVTVLPLETESDRVAPPGIGSGNRREGQVGKEIAKKSVPQSELPAVEDEKVSEASTQPAPVQVSATSDESNVLHAAASIGRGIATSSSGSEVGAGGGGGSGSSASGNGRGASSRPVITMPARYSDTPSPAYPESARREGREGRVLLRVLIDDRGETKVVEVSRSSGSHALDQAATNAIRRWRFHPARRGDEAVESWVNVPIDFRLTDNKNY